MKYFGWILIFLIPIKVWGLEINSNNAILYNLNDNVVLMEKDADEQVKIASLTKIMTAIVAIENIDNLNAIVRIPEEGLEGLVEANASVAGFKLGDRVTYLDLLYGVLLPSGADAVQTLTYYIAGSNEEFVKLMNEKANELELKDTHFSNPTGLNGDNHYSSVRDVSTILLYALENPVFEEIFTTKEYTTTNGLKFKSTLLNYQDRYGIDTSLIIGSKTGFTDESGYCLASVAVSKGVKYLLVTTGAPTNMNYPLHVDDAVKVYQYYSDNYSYLPIVKKGQVLYEIAGKYSKDIWKIKALEEIDVYTRNDTNLDDVEFIYEGDTEINPFTEKKEVGNILVKMDGKVIRKIPVSYDGSLSFSLGIFLKENYVFVSIIIVGLIGIIFLNKRLFNK